MIRYFNKVFDEMIVGTNVVYSSALHWKDVGVADRVGLQAVAMQSNASGVTVALQHSADGVNWMAKNATAEINNVAIANNAAAYGADLSAVPTLGLVRFAISMTAAHAPTGRIQLFVVVRDFVSCSEAEGTAEIVPRNMLRNLAEGILPDYVKLPEFLQPYSEGDRCRIAKILCRGGRSTLGRADPLLRIKVSVPASRSGSQGAGSSSSSVSAPLPKRKPLTEAELDEAIRLYGEDSPIIAFMRTYQYSMSQGKDFDIASYAKLHGPPPPPPPPPPKKHAPVFHWKQILDGMTERLTTARFQAGGGGGFAYAIFELPPAASHHPPKMIHSEGQGWGSPLGILLDAPEFRFAPTTMLELNSMSKTIMGAAFMALVSMNDAVSRLHAEAFKEFGEIKNSAKFDQWTSLVHEFFDLPLKQFLPPSWTDAPQVANGRLRIRHLLQHASGIGQEFLTIAAEDDDFEKALQVYYVDCKQALRNVRATDIDLYEYSNTNFAIMRYVLVMFAAVHTPKKFPHLLLTNENEALMCTNAMTIVQQVVFHTLSAEEVPRLLYPPGTTPAPDEGFVQYTNWDSSDWFEIDKLQDWVFSFGGDGWKSTTIAYAKFICALVNGRIFPPQYWFFMRDRALNHSPIRAEMAGTTNPLHSFYAFGVQAPSLDPVLGQVFTHNGNWTHGGCSGGGAWATFHNIVVVLRLNFPIDGGTDYYEQFIQPAFVNGTTP